MIFGIITVVLLFSFAPKIADKLSVIGIADDYILYDDFEKPYFDETLWDVEFTGGSFIGQALADEPDRIAVSGGWLSYQKYVVKKSISIGTFDYSSPNIVLSPKSTKQGMNIKTKIRTEAKYLLYAPSQFYYWSEAYLLINDVVVYTCARPDFKGDNTRTCTIEALASFENPEMYQLVINGEDYGVVNTSNPLGDGKVKIKSYAPDKGTWYAEVKATSKIYVDYFKYKIPYNCKIENDEVLVFDSFSEGSTVNISTLAYEPVKFCLDYPIKARSFSENGIKTDIRGEILQKIVRGQSSTVPPAEEWKVYYITKNTPNIELRCGVDEAYNTNTGICESPNEKAIVGCNFQSDCYIPPGCTGVTCDCVNDKCEYVGSCIYQPQTKSTSLWDKIMTLGFLQWISGLFN